MPLLHFLSDRRPSLVRRLRARRTRELALRSTFCRRIHHGGVTRLLGLLDEPARSLEGVLTGATLVEQNGSHRARDRPRPPVDRKRPRREQQTETLGEVGKLRALDMRGEHDELLPAPAKDEVARA